MSRRAHYRNASRTLRQAARDGRRARSSTRTTPSPPTRSASATTTGSPPSSPTSSTPTCWSCSPTSTALYDGDPEHARHLAGSPRCAAPADLARRRHRQRRQGRASAPAAWSPRSRPPGSRRPPASRWCSPPPPRRPTPSPAATPARYFHPHRQALRRPAAVAGARLHPAGPAAPWTTGRCARSSSGAPRCCRPGSPPWRASSPPGDPVDLRRRAGRARWPAASSTSTPRRSPSCSAGRPGSWPAELGPAYEREVVHRDDLVILHP